MERKLIAAAVSSALVLPMAAQAVEFSAYGHVNRAIISVDGGDNDSDVQHVDGNSSGSRFGFKGSEELDNGMTAGVQLEYSLSASVREAHLYLSTAGGKITVGHASTAADNMYGANLGGLSGFGGVTNWCAYHSTGPACPSNDGDRRPILKYDTPSIGPAAISVATGENDYWDVQLKLAGAMGDAGYDIRIGHIAEYDGATTDAVDEMRDPVTTAEITGELISAGSLTSFTPSATDFDDAVTAYLMKNKDVMLVRTDDGDENTALADRTYEVVTQEGSPAVTGRLGDVTTASAAVSFGQGTAIAVAWSQDEINDSEYQYMGLDHSYGDGSVGVYYKRGEMGGTDGSHWGVGVGHGLGSGVIAYAGYRLMQEDNEEDVSLLVAGMRVQFN